MKNTHALLGILILILAILRTSATAQYPQEIIENPQEGHSSLFLGFSSAIDGNTIVAGGPNSSVTGSGQPGLVKVFRLDGMNEWQLEAELYALDAKTNDNFGYSVDISGDTIIVGVPDDDDLGGSSGSAYIYTRSGTTWTQQAKLTASNGAGNHEFGHSVAIDGDTAFVGSYGISTVYTFTRSGTTWTEDQIIAGGTIKFGYDIDIDGTTSIIGSNGDGALVYVYDGSDWIFQEDLALDDSETANSYGSAVSISGETVVVGAKEDISSGFSDSGSVYIYTRSAGNWTQQQEITASNAAIDDDFGYSVDIDGDSIIVGAPENDSAGASEGAAYVFTRSAGVWSEQQILSSSYSGADPKYMGRSVGIVDDLAIAGADHDDNAGYRTGSVYCYSRSLGLWSLDGLANSSESASFDAFGADIDISGNTAIIGSVEDDASRQLSSASIYIHDGTSWSLEGRLIPDDPTVEGTEILSVAMDGDTAVLCLSEELFVFTRSAGTWTEQQKINPASNTPSVMALDSDTLVIGSPDDNPNGTDSGSVYVYVRNSGVWSLEQTLVPADNASGDQFGEAVSVLGDTLIAAAPGDDEGGANTKSIYIFTRSGSTWTQQDKFHVPEEFFTLSTIIAHSSDALFIDGRLYSGTGSSWTYEETIPAPNGDFGYIRNAAISGDYLIVGTPADNAEGSYEGAAQLYVRESDTWTWRAKLAPDVFQMYETFGFGAAVEGTLALVGSPYASQPEVSSGRVIAFDLSAPIAELDELTDNTFAGAAIPLPFEAKDNPGGNGIESTKLWVMPPGSSTFTTTSLTLTGDTNTFSYTPTDGDGVYAFATTATDNDGNVEPDPTEAEVEVIYNATENSSFTWNIDADGTFVFPMEDSIDVSITITGLSVTGTITVERFEGDAWPTGYASAYQFLNQYFTITSAGTAFTSATIVFEYDESSADMPESYLDRAYQDSGSTTEHTITLDELNNTVTVDYVSGFSAWYFGNSSGLPVQLDSFEVE